MLPLCACSTLSSGVAPLSCPLLSPSTAFMAFTSSGVDFSSPPSTTPICARPPLSLSRMSWARRTACRQGKVAGRRQGAEYLASNRRMWWINHIECSIWHISVQNAQYFKSTLRGMWRDCLYILFATRPHQTWEYGSYVTKFLTFKMSAWDNRWKWWMFLHWVPLYFCQIAAISIVYWVWNDLVMLTR